MNQELIKSITIPLILGLIIGFPIQHFIREKYTIPRSIQTEIIRGCNDACYMFANYSTYQYADNFTCICNNSVVLWDNETILKGEYSWLRKNGNNQTSILIGLDY
jgi:hypothetical protein